MTEPSTPQSSLATQVILGQASCVQVQRMMQKLVDREPNKVAKEECANDFGGYFIIKGKERVLVGQLRRAYNKVYVERTPEDKYEYMAEIRSMNEQGSSILIQLKINTITKELFFSLPYIKAKSLLPAGLVFKAQRRRHEEDGSHWGS